MKTRKQVYCFLLALALLTLQVLPGEIFPEGIFPAGEQAPKAAQVPEPVCRYSFNQTVGAAIPVIRENDTLEGSNAGTIPSENASLTVTYTEGISGKGIALDGSYGLKLFPQITGNQYSVSFWVKPETAGIFTPFLCAGESFLTEGETSLEITEDDSASPIAISTSPGGGYFAGKGQGIVNNTWNHVCMAVNGGKLQFYVNGSLQSEGAVLENILSEKTEWYLGIDCYNTLFTGSFDNIEFYDTCLSREAVSEVYSRGKNSAAQGAVIGISLNKNNMALSGYGAVGALYARISPENVENQEVLWKSSNEETATVENGVVRAWKNGTALITAETKDGNYKAECSVTVKDVVGLTGITLSEKTLVLSGDGSSASLTASAVPSGAYLPQLIWKTSDKNVAVVDENGLVTAVANGSAVITAETEDGSVSASCSVKTEGLTKEVAMESVEFSETSISLTEKKKTRTLKTKITPVNAANQQCTYYSEDEEVAVVDEEGRVTAVGNGTTNICVITSDGRFTDSCQVTVSGFQETKIRSIKLDYESLKISQGGTGYLYAETSPASASEDLYWVSSNPEVADVVPDEFGTSAEIIVYADAVMGSTAMITAYTEHGVSAECFIEVAEYGVKKISIEESNVCLLPGESFGVDAQIKPEEAATAELLWKSSDRKVAKVSSLGIVKVDKEARAGQTAKITSMSLSRKKKDSFTVTVKEKKVPVKKLTAKKKTFTLYPGQTAKFHADYSPGNATEHTILYESQNNKIVKVDSKGTISVPADYSGTAEVKVTAKTRNGKKVTAVVSVKQREVKVKKLSMSRSSLDLYAGKSTTLYVNYKPGNADGNVTWTSSNQNLVKVNGNGKRAAVQIGNVSGKGNAVITAKDANGATASCQVSVLPRISEDTDQGSQEQSTESSSGGKQKKELKTISFNNLPYVSVSRGKSVNLKKMLSVSPGDADYQLTWKNKNHYISVTNSGMVSVSAKAPKKLVDTILVTSDNGKKASIYIRVGKK